MTFPGNAQIVILRGWWWDALSRRGVDATITATPLLASGGERTPNLRDLAAFGHIKTRSLTIEPDIETGYYAFPAIANNDPDLDGYGGLRVDFAGEDPVLLEVDANAPTAVADAAMVEALAGLDVPVTVAVGDVVRTQWLVQAAVLTTPAPVPPTAYWTSSQTAAAINTAIAQHPPDVPDATTSVKGLTKLLGGTPTNPTVPWTAVTGAPTTMPPSGSAGGVLAGSYPTPTFAVDMATQVELDGHTTNTSNPHAVTKAQVGLSAYPAQPADLPVSTATSSALAAKANASALAALATSGAWTDVQGRPTKVYDLGADADTMLSGTGDVTLTTTAAQDIPGLTVTLTSPGPTAAWNVAAFLDVNSLTNNGAVLVGKLLIDGTERPSQLICRQPTSGIRGTAGQQWSVTGLAAGSHTVKLIGTLNDAGNYQVSGQHSTLSVRRSR